MNQLCNKKYFVVIFGATFPANVLSMIRYEVHSSDEKYDALDGGYVQGVFFIRRKTTIGLLVTTLLHKSWCFTQMKDEDCGKIKRTKFFIGVFFIRRNTCDTLIYLNLDVSHK